MRLIALSGGLLGAHFATWVPSLRFTTVASSTALVATQPVWAALIAHRRGVAITRVAWIGIALALLGALVLTGVDFALTPRALFGDALALAGAVLAALYVTVGEKVRATTSNPTYTTICYAVAAVFLLGLVLVAGVPLVGFSVRDWVLILAVTLGAQLLGHSVVNRVLATTSATIVSLAILLEMPGSTLIAAAWLGQVPPPAIIPAVVLMFAGIALVISSTTRPGGPPERVPARLNRPRRRAGSGERCEAGGQAVRAAIASWMARIRSAEATCRFSIMRPLYVTTPDPRPASQAARSRGRPPPPWPRGRTPRWRPRPGRGG